MIRKCIRLLLFTCLIGLVLMIFLALATQTRPFKTLLRDVLVRQINNQLSGKLYLDHIDGNLYHDIALQNVILTCGADTCLAVERLRIYHNPWRLLRKELMIEQIEIENMRIRLYQNEDSTWNVAAMVKTDTSDSEEKPQQPSSWQVRILNLIVSRSHVHLRLLDPQSAIPQQFTDIGLRAELDYSADGLQGRLWTLSCRTLDPSLSIRRLTFNAALRKPILQLDNVLLETTSSSISGNAQINLLNPGELRTTLQATPLSFTEVAAVLPDFPMSGAAQVNLSLAMMHDHLEFFALIDKNRQVLQCAGHIANWAIAPDYAVTLNFTNIQLQEWLVDPPLRIAGTGQIRMSGRGFDPKRLNAQSRTSMQRLTVADHTLDRIDMTANLHDGLLSLSAVGVAGEQNLKIRGRIRPFAGIHDYSIQADFAKVNLSGFTRTDVQSSLNGHMSIMGKHFDHKKLVAEGIVHLHKSKIDTFSIDSLNLTMNYNRGLYQISALQAASDWLALRAQGKGSLTEENEFNLDLHLKDAKPLGNFIHADSIAGHGDLHVKLNGTIDSLNVHGSGALTSLRFNNFQVDSAFVQGNVLLQHGLVTGTGGAALRRIMAGVVTIDQLDAAINSRQSLIAADLKLFSDSIAVRGRLLSDLSRLTFAMPQLEIYDGKKNWHLQSDTLLIGITPERYEIKNLDIRAGESRLCADGYFSTTGDEAMVIQATKLPMELFTRYLHLPPYLSGDLDLDGQIAGTAAAPILHATLQIRNPKYADFTWQKISAQADYIDQIMSLKLSVSDEEREIINGTGSLPLALSFSPSHKPIQVQNMSVIISSSGIDLNGLSAFSDQIQRPRGRLSFQIQASESLSKPRIEGHLSLSDVGFQAPKIGNFRNGSASFLLQNDIITMENLILHGGEGTLTARGTVEFASDSLQNGVKRMAVTLQSDRFEAANDPALYVMLNQNLQLNGQDDTFVVSGDMEILRSRILLQEFQGQDRDVVEYRPLLLQGEQTLRAAEETKTIAIQGQILQKLRGDIRIDIPRNTWVRSNEVNVEIAGTLSLVKENLDIELFGDVRVVRGSYSFYNRRFEIKKGQFIFKGGKEFNPQVELEARHRLRTFEGSKAVLGVTVSGELQDPKITFKLDDAEIETTDAVSYLLFGRNASQLSRGEKSDAVQQNTLLSSATLTNLLTGQIAQRLSETIGQELNLDVIEVKGDENWHHASVTIGKYLTNDILLSFEREFSFGASREPVPEKFSLEYEINRYLYLQATKGDEKSTGFDVIFKFQK